MGGFWHDGTIVASMEVHGTKLVLSKATAHDDGFGDWVQDGREPTEETGESKPEWE